MTSTKIKARKLKKDFMVEDEILSDNVDEVLVLSDKNAKDKSVKPRRVGTKKIRMSMSKVEEKRMEQEVQRDDNMSVGLMVLILVFCFVVGITLGYLLYRIALNGGM